MSIFTKKPEGEVNGLYVMYDMVAKEAGPIWSSRNDGVATRAFRALLRTVSPENRKDFKLFRVATYNVVDVTLKPEGAPVEVVVALSEDDLVKPVERN